MPSDNSSTKADHGSIRSRYISSGNSSSTSKPKLSRSFSSTEKASLKPSSKDRDFQRSPSNNFSKSSSKNVSIHPSVASASSTSKYPNTLPIPPDTYVEEYHNDAEDDEEPETDTYSALTNYTISQTRSLPRYALLSDIVPITVDQTKAEAEQRMRDMFEDFDEYVNLGNIEYGPRTDRRRQSRQAEPRRRERRL